MDYGKVYNKLINAVSHITVEPVVLCYIASWTMQSALTTNLLIDKVCDIQLDYGVNCTKLTEHSEQENNVQLYVSQLNMYSKLIQNVPAIFFILYLGAWSDLNGRKLPLILPFLGCFISSILCMMQSHFWYIPAEHILMTAVPRSITGGYVSLMMISYSYVSDISSESGRTNRIALLDLSCILGPPLGLYLADILFKNLGYTTVYGLLSVMYITSAAYVMIVISETKGDFSSNSSTADCTNGHIKSTMKSCLVMRPNRSKILYLMVLNCFMNLMYGSVGLDYLYSQKKLHWTFTEYIHYSITQLSFSAFGSCIALRFLSRYLKIGDYLIAILGCCSKIGECLCMGFSSKWWHLYIAAGIGFIGTIPISVSRSMVSKEVPFGDIGKCFSLLASWESIVPILSNPLYTFTYNLTIEVCPGMFFLLTAFIYIIALFGFLFSYIRNGSCEFGDTIDDKIDPEIYT